MPTDKELHSFVFGDSLKETIKGTEVFGDMARVADPILQEDKEDADKADEDQGEDAEDDD